jgi:hypothetical protein
MSDGFNTIGNRRWLVATVAKGKIATKSVISQSYGIKLLPHARTIMPVMAVNENKKLHLNVFKTLGTSMKKFDVSFSFAVAPHVMLISNICARRAEETWRERPPRKIASKGTHLKFSTTGRC